ncbi:unnamed protein product, partial [Polarella glacialis]
FAQQLRAVLELLQQGIVRTRSPQKESQQEAMEINRIFCAEQIEVPGELPDILKDFTKAVIREDPSAGDVDSASARLKLYQWSRDYFKNKLVKKTP